MLRVNSATSMRELEQIRDLFIDYSNSLGFDLSFQNFQKELNRTPWRLLSTKRRLFLGFHGSDPAGCVALRRISEEICEMKRLFVRPQYRGLGLGRVLAMKVIEDACEIGYRRMRLDTVPAMQTAIALYVSLGFKEIEPYRYNPLGVRSSWNCT